MSETSSFDTLAALLRSGARVDIQHVDRVLSESGRSARDLVAALASRPRSAAPGDRCQSCGGRIGVYATRKTAGQRTQYLACKQCGTKPAKNKRVEYYADSTHLSETSGTNPASVDT